MKITVGHISSIVLILLGIYLSFIWFINPLLDNTINDMPGLKVLLGGTCMFAIIIFSIIIVVTYLQKNWDRGFNINLKFNKNKE